MAFVPVPNTAMAELRYLLEGEPAENTLYFRALDGYDVTLLGELALMVKNWWITNIQPLTSVHAVLQEVFVTDLSSATAAALGDSSGLPLPGDLEGEMAPANVAPCISFRTANRGRSFRGRNYLLGIENTQITNSRMAAPYMGGMLGAYSQLLVVSAALGVEWVVVSRYSGSTIVDGKKVPTPRVTGLATPVTSVLFTDDVVDSQRGRLPNH
jgi:hypothetical protein